ncbi:DUF5979 domain-containing protein [Myceligenerans cantabricum]
MSGSARHPRRAATAVVLILTAVLVVAPAAVPPTLAAPEDVVAAGRAFEDADGDGVFDDDATDGFRERGVGDVTVTVTDALGRSATTRTERAQAWEPGTPADTPEDPNDPADPDVTPGHWYWESDGHWSMTEAEFTEQTGSVPFVKEGESTARLRVTFSDAPEGYQSWFAGDLAGGATSVQFVPAGSGTVDHGLVRPGDHRTDPLDVIPPPAPVGIGNRVWFDADQDGLQGADEPGIGGVTVELLDAAGDVVGTRTTREDGTYSFSSRESGEARPVPLEPGAAYTVRFVKPEDGELTVVLWGTTVTAPWATVPFTQTQVTAGDDPHDPADDAQDAHRHDSDPDTAAGEYGFTPGGPGEDDHSIDAGFVAYAPLRVEQLIDPEGGAALPGTTFDLTLDTSDFRGLAVGPDVPDAPDEAAAFTFDDVAGFEANADLVTVADPDGVADGVLTVQVGEDGTVPATTVWFPLGTTVEVAGAVPDAVKEVTSVPEGPVTLIDAAGATPLTVQVTSRLSAAAFSVTTSVTGEAAGQVPDGAVFTAEYSVDDGATWTDLPVPYDGDGDGTPAPAVSPDLPTGTRVLLCETDLPAPPPGVEWGDPTSSGDGVRVDPGTGCASFMVRGEGTVVDVGLANVARPAPRDEPVSQVTIADTAAVAPGRFTVTTTLQGEAAATVPDGTELVVEYSLDGGESWAGLSVPVGRSVTSGDLPPGTEVLLREGPLPEVEGVEWGDPVVAPSWVVLGAGTTTGVSVTGTAHLAPGAFAASRALAGEAAGDVPPGTELALEYSADGGGTWEPFVVTAGGAVVTSGDLPAGTGVVVRETGDRPDVPGVEWGDVVLSVDGDPVDGDRASFLIGAGTVAEVVATSTAEHLPGTFTVEKAAAGESAGGVPPGTEFTVGYAVEGEPATAAVVVGETWTSDELAAGAEITVSEVVLPEVDGVVRGDPALTVDGVPVDGDTVAFEIGAGAEVGVVVAETAASPATVPGLAPAPGPDPASPSPSPAPPDPAPSPTSAAQASAPGTGMPVTGAASLLVLITASAAFLLIGGALVTLRGRHP